MNDLDILPKGMDIPPRPTIAHGRRAISSLLYVGSNDFAYMKKLHFRGFFTIPNKKVNRYTTSERLAVAKNRDGIVVLMENNMTKRAMTASPSGDGWTTVLLKKAFKTEDGKLCVIEIAPIDGKGGR